MADKIISVRMPSSMVDELKNLVEKNHYLDVSEQIRSVIRNRMFEYKNPYAKHLGGIKERIDDLKAPKKVEILKEELRRILEELE